MTEQERQEIENLLSEECAEDDFIIGGRIQTLSQKGGIFPHEHTHTVENPRSHQMTLPRRRHHQNHRQKAPGLYENAFRCQMRKIRSDRYA